MESIFRVVLGVLLMVSAVSAAQFSIQESLERFSTLTGMCDGTAEETAEFVSHAIVRPVMDLARVHWKPGAVVSYMRLRSGYVAIAETREDFRKAYGH